MSKSPKSKPKAKSKTKRERIRPVRWLVRWTMRLGMSVLALALLAILAGAVLDPPITPYMWTERDRLGKIDHEWVPLEDIAPVMARSVVAAEDANFCEHWGFDMTAIRAAIEAGAARGASTISQQTVKNVYLWQGRSWPRKAIEALLTPGVEAIWPKRRILEVYLNVAEFDEGVFGVDAAAHHYFGVAPIDLTEVQASRLAAVLPNPKERSASRPSASVNKRARSIAAGAATIRVDGRDDCFES